MFARAKLLSISKASMRPTNASFVSFLNLFFSTALVSGLLERSRFLFVWSGFRFVGTSALLDFDGGRPRGISGVFLVRDEWVVDRLWEMALGTEFNLEYTHLLA